MGFLDELFRYSPALEFALTKWFGDKATLKYIIMLIVLSALTAVGMLAAVVAPIMGFIGGDIQQNLLRVVGVLPQVLGAMFVVLIAGSLAMGYVSALVAVRALQIAGYLPPTFGPYKYLRFIVLNILVSVFAILSINRLRWLAVLAAVAAAWVWMAISPGNMAALATAFIASGLYAIVVIYNFLRLVFSSTILLNSNSRVLECIRDSNRMTGGRVWSIMAVLFIFGVLSSVVQGAAGALQPPTDQTVQMIAGGEIGIVVIIWIAATMLSLCVSLVFVAMGSFLNAGLFKLVSADCRSAPAASGKQ